MARTMIDVDEEALSAAAERLGTTTKRDTVNEALRRVARSPTQASAVRAILALATDLGDRDVMKDAWQARPQSRTRKPR
jgi:Arc/MetJ family transcription regulator